MASKRIYEPVKAFANVCSKARYAPQPFLTRSMATTTIDLTSSSSPAQTIESTYADAHLASTATSPILTDTFTQPPPPTLSQAAPYQPPPNPFLTTATCTLHAFPSLEPVSYTSYPDTHLLLPLRRDILHRAIVFEGDKTRQGTASTKYRTEVHGSNRKIRPQKGLGKARLGDKKSPMLKGGGVAFGPKPRDFSTDLPRKVYDLAWRTALSYRYRRGELVVLDGEAEIERQGPGSGRWVREMLRWNNLGKNAGRSLFVTSGFRGNLTEAFEARGVGREARVLTTDEVDVKDLLELGRVVIEKSALDEILAKRSSDLQSKVQLVV